MASELFSPGTQVVHKKMQVIGQVVKTENDYVHVKVASTMPIQVWKMDDLTVWNAKEEIQKKLKQGGYIRNIYKKIVN